MSHTQLPPQAVPLQPGDTIREGDWMKLTVYGGYVYYDMRKCLYDQRGEKCCVDRPVSYSEEGVFYGLR
jgi:hypothetical protein